jgi:hypothetical protein
MFAGFALAAFFLLFSIQSIPFIVFSPESFTQWFSLSMLSLLFALFMRRNLT